MNYFTLDTYDIVWGSSETTPHIEKKNECTLHFNPNLVGYFLTAEVEADKDYIWLIIENRYKYVIKKSDFASILQL